MKVLLDTNILISAALNPNGVPFKAYVKAVSAPNCGVVSDQNIDELRRVFNRKFPDKLAALERFLSFALPSLEIVPTPTNSAESENLIRDSKDRPILRAAIVANVEVLVTGDRDFLESRIDIPRIMTDAEFMQQE